MGSDNEELFQDDILYGDDDDAVGHETASSDGEECHRSEHRTPFSAAKQKTGVDIAGQLLLAYRLRGCGMLSMQAVAAYL